MASVPEPHMDDSVDVNDPGRIQKQIEEFLSEHGHVEGDAAELAVSSLVTDDRTDFDLVFRGSRMLLTAGIVPREVGIRDGKIVASNRSAAA